MRARLTFLIAALVVAKALLPQEAKKIPRTPDGRPDLSGMYDTATLTPLERPVELGDKLLLTPEEAESIRAKEAARTERLALPSEVERDAPPLGGDGSPGAAGNVGGYNNFWIDRGTEAFTLEGKFRTSIIVEPKNGRVPEMTPAGKKRRAAWVSLFGKNTGEAWWLDRPGPGPYDNPEGRPLGERCLLAFGSSSGPPSLPVLYNNFKRIVQTPDYVVILVEMVHDARIIPLNREHAPKEIRKWMGDSVGHWEGDTLVVDTTNFTDKTAFRGASENLHVVERFTRVDENTVLYQFTIHDPETWETTWSGEYPWVATDDAMYEYACHEANYALGNILRGARLLEAEAEEKKRGKHPCAIN
ncbi:MAG: hypothetical protein E2P02_14550 [Acidobacteria bacterium]|nr:MAG: hypothetical protein E2P02_14550 [Acidobacteriota bacterium]